MSLYHKYALPSNRNSTTTDKRDGSWGNESKSHMLHDWNGFNNDRQFLGQPVSTQLIQMYRQLMGSSGAKQNLTSQQVWDHRKNLRIQMQEEHSRFVLRDTDIEAGKIFKGVVFTQSTELLQVIVLNVEQMMDREMLRRYFKATSKRQTGVATPMNFLPKAGAATSEIGQQMHRAAFRLLEDAFDENNPLQYLYRELAQAPQLG